jgi:hypothetical protein
MLTITPRQMAALTPAGDALDPEPLLERLRQDFPDFVARHDPAWLRGFAQRMRGRADHHRLAANTDRYAFASLALVFGEAFERRRTVRCVLKLSPGHPDTRMRRLLDRSEPGKFTSPAAPTAQAAQPR